jgi:hypothetical protein
MRPSNLSVRAAWLTFRVFILHDVVNQVLMGSLILIKSPALLSFRVYLPGNINCSVEIINENANA